MLAIDNLSKTYADGTQALAGIDLAVPAGEIVALIGGSGCGKTTLIRLVAGLDRPSAGRILLDGAVIDRPSPRVGVVFQEARLLPWLSVADNVAFGLDALPRAERSSRVERALAAIGLPGIGARWPRDLSGGQAQRVALARALVPRPSALLLDEPFSALDALTRAMLRDQLLALWSEHRPTLLMATHDVDEAVALADRVVVMRPKPGRIGEVIRLDLPRPRARRAPAVEAAARRLLDALDRSQDADAAARPTVADGAGLWW